MRKLLSTALALSACVAAAAAWAAPAAESPVVAAALKSQRAGSASVVFRLDVAVGGVSFAISGQGTVSGQAARLRLRYPGSLLPTGDGTAELVFRVEEGSPVVYARAALLEAKLPPGKRWVRLDLGAESRRVGLDGGALTSAAGVDASLVAALLRQASTTVRVGAEVVRGERTTRYRVRIDLEKAALRSPRLAPTLRWLQQLIGSRLLTADAWVDSAGYLRQIRETLGFRGPITGQRVKLRISFAYVGFGRRAAIAAPPAAEVADLSIADLVTLFE